MAGMDLFVSRSRAPSSPNVAISHPPGIRGSSLGFSLKALYLWGSNASRNQG